jgi:8-oxo-dGTP pyrophosphatase MutT (NUDIX family)
VRRNLRVAAYAICVREGQILLSRSPAPDGGPPERVLPGGGMDHGEDPYDTVLREVAEETGYRIEVAGLLGVDSSHRVFPRRYGRAVDHHGVRLVYEGRVTGGELLAHPRTGFARLGREVPPSRSAAPPTWPPGTDWTRCPG